MKKQCTFCKKIFEPKYNKKKVRKYCSLKCCYEHRKTGWKSKRLEALRRARNKCERCSSQEKLHVHHKEKAIYKRGHFPKKGSNNNLSNLLVLCSSCHVKEHSTGVKRFVGKAKCVRCRKEFKYYPKSNRGKYCSRGCFYGRKK